MASSPLSSFPGEWFNTTNLRQKLLTKALVQTIQHLAKSGFQEGKLCFFFPNNKILTGTQQNNSGHKMLKPQWLAHGPSPGCVISPEPLEMDVFMCGLES